MICFLLLCNIFLLQFSIENRHQTEKSSFQNSTSTQTAAVAATEKAAVTATAAAVVPEALVALAVPISPVASVKGAMF